MFQVNSKYIFFYPEKPLHVETYMLKLTSNKKRQLKSKMLNQEHHLVGSENKENVSWGFIWPSLVFFIIFFHIISCFFSVQLNSFIATICHYCSFPVTRRQSECRAIVTLFSSEVMLSGAQLTSAPSSTCSLVNPRPLSVCCAISMVTAGTFPVEVPVELWWSFEFHTLCVCLRVFLTYFSLVSTLVEILDSEESEGCLKSWTLTLIRFKLSTRSLTS